MHVSPVEHLFSSDEVPTNAESEIIHAILSDTAKELADIDAQLEETRANLARLSCMQDDLKSFMAHHRSLIAPIRLLPTEILSEIFILCLPVIGGTLPETGALRAPLLLAQVSWRWRNVALSTPQLWNEIIISINKSDDILGALEAARLWLDRSGACPISLYIRTANLACKPILDLIILHSDRWKDVSFVMPLSMHFYMNEIRGRLSQLSSLHLSATKVDVPLHIEELAPLACYSSAPRLSTIKMSEPFIPTFLTLPWEQITFWEGITDERSWFDMLEKTPNLRTCSFTKVYTLGRQDPIFARPLPTLKYLETLDLTLDLRSSSFLLETMPILPSLKCLRVTSNDISGFSQEGLASFLSKNGLGIGTLKLCIRDTTEEDLVLWLSRTPAVTELEIDSSSCTTRPVNDRFLDELVYRPGQSSCIIPKLKLLRLKGDILFSDHAFLLMIYSRWRPSSTEETINGSISRLQTVHLICGVWVRMNADLTARLLSLRNQGLRLMIHDT